LARPSGHVPARQPCATEGKYVEDGSLVVRDDEEEDALESWVDDDAWLMIATGWRLSMDN